MSAAYLAKNRGKLPVDVISVPKEIDEEVASMKLAALDISIDQLSKEQRNYLGM